MTSAAEGLFIPGKDNSLPLKAGSIRLCMSGLVPTGAILQEVNIRILTT